MRIFVWITLLVALFTVIEAQFGNDLPGAVGVATGNAIKGVGNALGNNVISSSLRGGQGRRGQGRGRPGRGRSGRGRVGRGRAGRGRPGRKSN